MREIKFRVWRSDLTNIMYHDNIRELIRTCLDLDEWKYSWHMPSLDYTDPEIAAEIENIIKHKIQRREKELKMLKNCLKIINMVKRYTKR